MLAACRFMEIGNCRLEKTIEELEWCAFGFYTNTHTSNPPLLCQAVGWLLVCLFICLFVCFGDSTSDSFTSFKIIFIILHCSYKLHIVLVMHGHQFFHVDFVAVSSSFHLVFQSCLPTLLLLSHLYIFFPYLFFGVQLLAVGLTFV